MRPVVPFIDLGYANALVVEPVMRDIAFLAGAGEFIGGDAVTGFEVALRGYLGRPCAAAGVSSGLDALRLALMALDRHPGHDEVIIPAMTFVATAEAVEQAGFRIRLVDVLEDGTLDPEALGDCSFVRMHAVVPVHLYGQMADMAAISAVCRPVRVPIVEDAAQALGAVRDTPLGELSTAVALKLYPTKPLGGWGDGGAILSPGWMDDRVRELREHGQREPGVHHRLGYTARLDAIQAAVLHRKLEHLDRMQEIRRHAAVTYLELLAGVGDLVLPTPQGQHAWHLFPVRTGTPELLREHLRLEGVGSGRHYARAIHRQPAFRDEMLPAGAFPVAERIAASTLSLPLWPGITEAQQEHVAAAIKAWFDGRTEVPR